MKIIFSTYRLLLLFCLLGVLTLAAGCAEEHTESSPQPQEYDGHNAICITARAVTEEGSTAESAIRTLRLIVFDAKNGGILLNTLYHIKDALSQIPEDYPYFVADAGGDLHLSVLLPKTTIKLMVIANELNPPPTNADTPEKIEKSVIDFYNAYQTEGKLNIGIDASNSTSNIGYIQMFAETDQLIHYEWDASNHKNIELSLKRLLAKVTLKLTKGQITSPQFGANDKLTISTASIQHATQYSYMGETGIQYVGSQVSTVTKTFGTPLIVTTENGDQSSDVLAFYVPEHVLSGVSFTNLQYTYLQINGVYHSADTNEDIATSYQIPLGNGVGKLYTGEATGVTNLLQEDFTISRNTIYRIEAEVATIGKLEIFQVVVGVNPWEGTVEIPGDIDAPVLNISSINVKMSSRTVRVHFWSNQPNPYFSTEGTDDSGNAFTVNDVFKDLCGVPGTSTSHFYLLNEGDDLYLPYNGYMDIEFTDDSYYNTGNSYKLVLNAGRLKRTITITAQNIVL